MVTSVVMSTAVIACQRRNSSALLAQWHITSVSCLLTCFGHWLTFWAVRMVLALQLAASPMMAATPQSTFSNRNALTALKFLPLSERTRRKSQVTEHLAKQSTATESS